MSLNNTNQTKPLNKYVPVLILNQELVLSLVVTSLSETAIGIEINNKKFYYLIHINVEHQFLQT